MLFARCRALTLAAVFGALDLQLALRGGASFWFANMSAFWLLLPFVVGARERSSRSAAVMGLLVTLSALEAFYLCAHDPLLRVSHHARLYLAAGMLTGPAFGVLGSWWGDVRAWPGAAALSTAFLLEPLAWRAYRGSLPEPGYVWDLEVLAGVLIGAWFLLALERHHSAPTGRRPSAS